MWVELLCDESLHCVVMVCSGAVATVSDGHCGLDPLQKGLDSKCTGSGLQQQFNHKELMRGCLACQS